MVGNDTRLALASNNPPSSPSNQTELVRLLVESGASIEKRDSQNQTALLLACAMNSLPIAQYLLSVGANVNAVDKVGVLPSQLW